MLSIGIKLNKNTIIKIDKRSDKHEKLLAGS